MGPVQHGESAEGARTRIVGAFPENFSVQVFPGLLSLCFPDLLEETGIIKRCSAAFHGCCICIEKRPARLAGTEVQGRKKSGNIA